MSRRMILAIGVAGGIGFAMAPRAEAAGFLDNLTRAIFGGPMPPAMIGGSDGPVIRPKTGKPRQVASKPAEPAVKLDPASDPYWYLRDPTLRKGDIVVTRSGIVVFDGRQSSEHASSAFTALEDTKRLPKAQQQTLQAAAERGRAYFTPSTSAPIIPVMQTKTEIGTTAQAH